MNKLIILGALLVVQGEFTSIYKYKCTSNHIDNQIILSIKNEVNYVEELYDSLKSFPAYKIELSNQNKEDNFLFYKITFQDCDDNNLHYYLNKTKNINAIESASLNYYLKPQEIAISDDPYYDYQYYLNTINCNWNFDSIENSIYVGIIDTGIDGNHPDLQKNINRELSHDFSGSNDSINYEPLVDSVGHGTQIAGIIGATSNNGIGIKGIMPNVSLVSLKISNDLSQSGALYNAVEAINYANEKNIKLLNLSWMFPSDFDNPLKQAISNYDGLVICAAGNDYVDIDNKYINNRYPSLYTNDNIISVGATDCNDNKVNYSNYGIKSVDLFAPGHNIFTTNSTTLYNEKEYISASGTSFAAPMVTGVAALILALYPQLKPLEIKEVILKNVDPLDNLKDMCVTGGRLNAYNALSEYHTHNYSFSYNDNMHTYVCSCGDIKSSSSHSLKTTYNSKTHTYSCDCGYTKTSNHDLTFSYIDNKCHGDICTCGYYENESPHIVKQSSISNNKATCLECNRILNLKTDFAFTDGNFDIVYLTLNGSYKLPNGIIVLQDIDYQKYIDGSLSFNGNDSLIN